MKGIENTLITPAVYFLDPVDTTRFPDYVEVIPTPMDFGTIKKNLDRQRYKTVDEFERDVQLVFSNCFEYNTGDSGADMRAMGHRVKVEFDKLMLQYHEQKTPEGSNRHAATANAPTAKSDKKPVSADKRAKAAAGTDGPDISALSTIDDLKKQIDDIKRKKARKEKDERKKRRQQESSVAAAAATAPPPPPPPLPNVVSDDDEDTRFATPTPASMSARTSPSLKKEKGDRGDNNNPEKRKKRKLDEAALLDDDDKKLGDGRRSKSPSLSSLKKSKSRDPSPALLKGLSTGDDVAAAAAALPSKKKRKLDSSSSSSLQTESDVIMAVAVGADQLSADPTTAFIPPPAIKTGPAKSAVASGTPRSAAKSSKAEKSKAAVAAAAAALVPRPRWVLECLNVLSKLFNESKSGKIVQVFLAVLVLAVLIFSTEIVLAVLIFFTAGLFVPPAGVRHLPEHQERVRSFLPSLPSLPSFRPPFNRSFLCSFLCCMVSSLPSFLLFLPCLLCSLLPLFFS
jgi:hypothetical protein